MLFKGAFQGIREYTKYKEETVLVAFNIKSLSSWFTMLKYASSVELEVKAEIHQRNHELNQSFAPILYIVARPTSIIKL